MPHIQLDNLPGIPTKNALLQEVGLLAIRPAGSDSFSEHLQRAQTQGGEASTAGDREDAERSSPAAAVPDAGDPPPTPHERSDDKAAGDSQEATSSRGPGSDDQPPAPTDAQASDAVKPREEKTGGQEPAEAPTSGPDAHKDKKSRDVAAGDQPQATAAGHGDPSVAHAVLRKGKTTEGNGGDAEPAAGKSDEAGRTPSAAQAGADKVKLGRTAAGKQAGEDAAAGKASAGESPAIEAEAPTSADAPAGGKQRRSRPAAKQKPAAAADRVAADRSAADAADNGAEKADRPSDQRRPAELDTADGDAPRRAERHDDKKHPAAGRSDQAASKRPEASAGDGASAPTLKVETPKTTGEQVAAVVEKAAKPVADTVEPSAADTTGKQPGASAGDKTNGPARSAASAADPKGQDSAPIDRARFVQRVAKAFQALGERGGTVRLRLSPPELGSLRVEISVRQGAMTARVQADNPATRNLLLDNLPALRERLAQQDIRIEQFHVDLMDHSPGEAAGQSAGQAQSQSQGGGYHAPQAAPERLGAAQPASPRRTAHRPGEGSQLDVLI